ncbi:hypothetical protein Zmor_016107 [Zophobas morio]|uniref:RING-type E3 ubiquitin transferase n=1 Tax=Zophobas morio TaxID=2755281 RepID=A0AA38IKK0_9CUCU|nr:hypothetical protein Zmor_016107 [Zophobas morio]
MANKNIQNFAKEMLNENVFSCRVCKNLLAVPVMMVENIGDVCHSCFQTKNEENDWNSLPNTTLDTILRKLLLPCKFQSEGCETEVLCDVLKQHENKCSYRLVDCLMPKEQCEWLGKSADLFKHFEEEHETHVLKEQCGEYSFEIDPRNFGTITKLLTYNNKTHVLKIKKSDDDNSLLQFLKGESNMVVEYTGKSNVFETKLQALSFDVAFDERNGQKIQLSTLKEVMQEDEVVKVVIKPEKYELKDVNYEITKHLECPVCKDIMRQPILLCCSGHSNCQSCRNNLSRCPTCRKAFPVQNIRNFSLEALTPFAEYECVYSQFGCTSTLLGSEIDEHEDGCTYQTYECPKNNCEFKGNFAACRNHFKVQHTCDLVKGTVYETSIFPIPFTYTRKLYFFEYGNIFELSFTHHQNSCSCFVRILTKYNKRDKYYFIVRLVSSDDAQCFITKSECCLDRNDNETSFMNNNLLPYEDSFQNKIKFYCEIKKTTVCINTNNE